MTIKCQSNPSAKNIQVRLESNSVGPAMEDEVAGLREVRMSSHVEPGYRGGRNCTDTEMLCSIVARHETIPEASVRITGSTLQAIWDIGLIFAGVAGTVVALETDFPMYMARAGDLRQRAISIPIDLEVGGVDPSLVASSVRGIGPAVFFITVPRLNPGGALVSSSVIIAALEANPHLIVVLDGAYQRFVQLWERQIDGANYAQFATMHDRVIYIQSGDKHLGGLCDTKVGWLVSTSRLLRKYDEAIKAPYPVLADGLVRASKLLSRPDLIKAITKIQLLARRAIIDSCNEIGLRYLPRPDVPWAMIELGDTASDITERLASANVFIQLQTKIQRPTWVRVSATVPKEVAIWKSRAEIILSELSSKKA